MCARCTAALRRARHAPDVKAEDRPQASVARTDGRRWSERHGSYSRAAATPALGGWGTYATIIAFGLAVCLTGYLAIGDSDRVYVGGSYAATAPAAAPTPALVEARDDAVAKAGRSPMPSRAVDAVPASSLATDPEAFYDAITDEHVAIFESLAPAPHAVADGKAARDGKRAKDKGARQVAANAGNNGTKSPAAAVTHVPVVRVEVATTSLAESMAPDRFEQLASALGRCERENVIVGLVCKERARLQYCEGEWGVVPECPAAVASLNTR